MNAISRKGSPVRRMPSECESLAIRGVRYNLRRWGRKDAKPILFLHGTHDSSITFQFVVDCLREEWCVLAPDWRGHGHSSWVSQGYWFHEFVADLDVLMDILFPGGAVPIVGHSLGGNIGGVFAGLRPNRLTHLVSLDGFGPLVGSVPVDVKTILRTYFDMPKRRRQHSEYTSIAEVASRLTRANPRLTSEQALFLAEHSTTAGHDGRRRWLFDPSYKTALPTLHHMAEWASVWAEIRVPVCWISSHDTRPSAPVNTPGELERRAGMIHVVRHETIPGTGHNVHHDAPIKVAATIEEFLHGTERSAV